jgi:hypothetical protein
MLLSGAAAGALRVDSPLVNVSGFARFTAHPFAMLGNIAIFRDQPYLAGVLPLYVLLVLALPLVMPVARRAPAAALLGSFALWFASSWLGGYLPSVPGSIWPFNPFAWQAMFMLGLLCRLYPISDAFQTSRFGRGLTLLACVLVAVFAFVRLFVEVDPQPGYMKQNLASVRIVSFATVAWLAVQATRLGWVGWLAQRLPGIVTVGQQGLVCFVGGALASNTIDTLLRVTHSNTLLPARLVGDALAIAALLMLAGGARRWKAERPRVALT